MTNVRTKKLKFAPAAILLSGALAALMVPVSANAVQVSGIATITIDNMAFKAANDYEVYLEKHWGPEDNSLDITKNTTGGTTISLEGITATLFPVNTNTTTLELTPPCGDCSPLSFGRTLQATTMDSEDTSVGQIGLSGAWRLNSPYGVLTPYDFSLAKTNGVWNIRTYDSSYLYQDFMTLTDVSESFDLNGRLMLSGNLKWANALWPTMAGGDTTKVVGTFNLAPAAVPIPVAGWLFGGGLLSLIGAIRRKSKSNA